MWQGAPVQAAFKLAARARQRHNVLIAQMKADALRHSSKVEQSMTAMHVVCQRMRAELELVAGADDDVEDDHPEQACHIRVWSGLARRVI